MNTVLFVNDGYANIWTRDYLKRQPQARKSLVMPSSPSSQLVVDTIAKAAKQAGPNGTLIFNLGHGGTSTSGDAREGFIDLAPGKKFRIGGQQQDGLFINVFYDVNVAGPNAFSDMDNDRKFNAGTAGATTRQQHFVAYKKIGDAIRAAGLYRVIFLTCKVGNSPDLIRKIANDWGVAVTAPKRRVVLAPQPKDRVRVHLEGDAPDFGTNVATSEEELFVFTDFNSYSAGPPLRNAA
jgi:hypothetical protein